MPEHVWILLAFCTGALVTLLPALLLSKQARQSALDQGRQQREPELAALQERLSGREEQLRLASEELRACRARQEQFQTRNSELESARASLETRLAEEIRRSGEKLEILAQARQELHTQFAHLANRIFDEKTRSFADQSRANLDAILTPFRDKICEFENRVNQVYSTEGKERHSLIREVQRLQALNQQISSDAENLTRALKGDSRVRGNWGEVILERLLEESGLRKGIEYQSQGGFRDSTGRLFKPDVVVHLPEGKDIVIDSKVSLVAYERSVSAINDAERATAINNHLQSVRTHLKGLENKRYDQLPGINSLDFVLMFVPIESAFMLAIDQDPEIFRQAFEQNILIVSPSTLLVTLRTIQNIWRYEHQNKNALEIAERAGRLYDKFVGFVQDLEKIGEQIDISRKTYEAAYNKLSSGRGNLVSRAQSLIELGVKARRQLPETDHQPPAGESV